MQDYTFNAPETLYYDNDFYKDKDGETWDAAYDDVTTTFLNRMQGDAGAPVQRNRKDPVSQAIEDYFNEVAVEADNSLMDAEQSQKDAKLETFKMHELNINHYNTESFQNLVNILIASTLWDHKDDLGGFTEPQYLTMFLPGFTHIDSLAINTPIKDIILNTNKVPQAVDWSNNTVTIKNLRNFLLDYARHMYAHNRYLTPNIDLTTTKQDQTALLAAAAPNPPTLTKSEFAHYTQKYLSMFKMCAQQGVSSYSLDATQRTNTRLFVQMGEALLLYAVWFGLLSYLYEQWKYRSDPENINEEYAPTQCCVDTQQSSPWQQRFATVMAMIEMPFMGVALSLILIKLFHFLL